MLCICAAPEHRDALCKRYRSFRGGFRCAGADPHVASSAVYRPTTTPILRAESEAGDAASPQSRHSRGRGSDQLQPWPGSSDFDSRARPLHIPPDQWEGRDYEPDHLAGQQLQQHSGGSGQAYGGAGGSGGGGFQQQSQHFQSHHQQRSPAEKRNELIISAKQFKDGYSYSQSPKSAKPSYLEQFWVCGAR